MSNASHTKQTNTQQLLSCLKIILTQFLGGKKLHETEQKFHIMLISKSHVCLNLNKVGACSYNNEKRWYASPKRKLVNCCFESSQPPGIISGLKETFTKRHTVERTNKAEKRPEEQSEKTECCRENLWNEIQLKGP